jgi:Fic family protein
MPLKRLVALYESHIACRSVFAGNLPDIEKIDERDEDYAEELVTLAATGRGTDSFSVIRSRHEIVQHAIAMKYIIDMLVVKDVPLDESIIRETHRLLMEYSDHEETGGVYRSSDEAASHGLRLETDEEYNARVKIARKLKPNRAPSERMTKPLFFSKFVRGGSVPVYMGKLVEEFNKDIQFAEENGSMDPIDLATKYCNSFVCTHPFEDGNGRICRLIMNSILLKYTGTVVEIGVDANEREKYIEQAFNANREFTKEDQEDIP